MVAPETHTFGLQRANGPASVTLAIAPARHAFRFVVDLHGNDGTQKFYPNVKYEHFQISSRAQARTVDKIYK